jgi:hypothetical protein
VEPRIVTDRQRANRTPGMVGLRAPGSRIEPFNRFDPISSIRLIQINARM